MQIAAHDSENTYKCVLKMYMKLNCFSQALIDRFLTEARAHVVGLEVGNPQSSVWVDEAHRLATMAAMENDPNVNASPKYPSIWDIVSIHQMVEAPMHTAKNCQSSVLASCIHWCTTYKKGSEFCRKTSSMLEGKKQLKMKLAW